MNSEKRELLKTRKKNFVPYAIIILIILCALMVGVAVNQKSGSNNDSGEFELLAVKLYSNYAWGFQFNGTAIFTDGSIYTWSHSGNKNIGDYKINTAEGLKKYIMDKGKKKLKSVSKKDLDKIKKYVNEIKKEDINLSKNCHGADMGSSTFEVHKNGELVLLYEKGDCDRESDNKKVNELVDIITKYTK